MPKEFDIYFCDLNEKAQRKLTEFLSGDNGNYDVFPIATVYNGDNGNNHKPFD